MGVRHPVPPIPGRVADAAGQMPERAVVVHPRLPDRTARSEPTPTILRR